MTTTTRNKMPVAIARECGRALLDTTNVWRGGNSVWTMRTVDACCAPGWEIPLDARQEDWFPLNLTNCTAAYRANARPVRND